MTARRHAASAAALLLFWLAPGAFAAAAAAGAIEVHDDSGNLLRLERPARRIVALAPHLAELLFEAGAGPAVVGTAAHSDYPEAAKSIPRIGDARALDLERIVALRPDLVVAWASGSPKRQLSRLRALGIPVFENEPVQLEAIGAAIERFGLLAGTSAVATRRANDFRRALGELRAQREGASTVRVFYQLAARPLVTVSRNHVIADALHVCGAVSVFAGEGHWLPRPSREAVLAADPDAIVVASGADEDGALEQWRRWQKLAAVRAGRLHRVDPSLLHRATPRILEGIRSLCAHMDAARSTIHAATKP